MKFFPRSCLVLLSLVAPWSHASLPDESLVGCWRAVKIVLYAPGGSKTEDTSGRCTLQFKADQFESTCATSSGTATTTYQYRIVRANFYAATMTRSTFRTDLIGATREYEYHVDGDRLVTVSHPQAAASVRRPVAPRVESEASRTPCN